MRFFSPDYPVDRGLVALHLGGDGSGTCARHEGQDDPRRCTWNQGKDWLRAT
jgi:hypothetical protein